MWLKILRQNISHLARRAKGSASIEQKNGNGNNKANKTNNNGADVNRNEEQNGSLDKSQAKKKPIVPGGTPLLQQTEISNSQLDFFRMLDEKIESGPDYDESSDATLRAEHVASLLRSWELASVAWSSVELNSSAGSPAPNLRSQYQQQQPSNRGLASQRSAQPYGRASQPAPAAPQLQAQQPSAKDREGMRNIVGGRPESAPVYVHPRLSSANRLDGLQDVVGLHHQHQLQQQQQPHCLSPSMPRHVLESISQSPTQSLKTPPGVASPTSLGRYPQYQQPEHLKLAKLQYGQAPAGHAGPLNGEAYREREYAPRREQPYDSPVLLRNSPSNPYLGKFHINASPSPQASPVQSLQQQQQQQRYDRKRTGAYGTAQMT